MSQATTTSSVSGSSAAPGSATTSSTPSATSLIALTTPFTPPPSCGDIWTTTSIAAMGPLVVSNTADPRFAACQPSGWDAVDSASRFTFSPAVCPSDWTAYSISKVDGTTWQLRSSSTATTINSYTVAYCCARGFTLSNPTQYVRGAFATQRVGTSTCVQDIQATPGGIRIHQAWQIRWAESDIKSLSPAPPTLTCHDKRLATWVPGSAATDQACSPDPNNDSRYLGNLIYLVTIPPVVVFVLILACCFFCCRHRRKQRRQRNERMEQANQDKAQRDQPMQPTPVV
ncbi:hypothetical protein RB595_004325 [Gaeumannomyces hyphopodioides]